MVVDARDGLTPLDQEVAKRLQYVETPIICVANKADDAIDRRQCRRVLQARPRKVAVHQHDAKPASAGIAGHDRRTTAEALPENATPPPEGEMKVAIVGRRNVGKSTFVNTLAHAERMIVSEVPGTTRDSVDVRFELDGKAFIAIDTPGLKRGRSIASDVEYYSLHRAQRSVRRADVVLLFFDPHAADQQSRQATVRLHCGAIQAVHVCGEQMGFTARRHADGKMGALSTRHISCACITCRLLSSPAKPVRT